MFRIASWLDVKIGVVARRALRLNRIVVTVGGQLLYLIENILTDEEALLHPSGGTGDGAYFYKVTIVVEDFHAVAIFYAPRFFVNGRDVVAQDCLHRGNIVHLKDASASTIAAREE